MSNIQPGWKCVCILPITCINHRPLLPTPPPPPLAFTVQSLSQHDTLIFLFLPPASFPTLSPKIPTLSHKVLCHFSSFLAKYLFSTKFFVSLSPADVLFYVLHKYIGRIATPQSSCELLQEMEKCRDCIFLHHGKTRPLHISKVYFPPLSIFLFFKTVCFIKNYESNAYSL